MMRKAEGVHQGAQGLGARLRTDIGVSRPFTIDQFEENVFAALIGDWDPMHNDPSWQFDPNWHQTIVLGFHTLSLAERFLREAGLEAPATVGLGRVRFVAPLPVGCEARCTVHLNAVDSMRGAAQTTLTVARTDTGSATMLAEHTASLGGHRSAAVGAPRIDSIPAGTPIHDAGVHDQTFYEGVKRREGEWLGSTPWTTVDTRSANTFRVLIGEQIAANHPSPHNGKPILLHPLHLLALRSYFMPQVGLPVLSDDYMAAFNYGVDEARWFADVPANSRLRDHVQLVSVREKESGRWLIKTRHILEVEGSRASALSADCLSLFALLGHR
jgi:acyl dehydratase